MLASSDFSNKFHLNDDISRIRTSILDLSMNSTSLSHYLLYGRSDKSFRRCPKPKPNSWSTSKSAAHSFPILLNSSPRTLRSPLTISFSHPPAPLPFQPQQIPLALFLSKHYLNPVTSHHHLYYHASPNHIETG